LVELSELQPLFNPILFQYDLDDNNLLQMFYFQGHTKLLNFFQVGKKFTLVDMPGYGYNMPHHYADSVESFLNSRKKFVSHLNRAMIKPT
jgi:GTP-binding protein EngB required for normal cell division